MALINNLGIVYHQYCSSSSGFGPYHCLVHADAPTERTGVIPTPWTMPLTLGFGAILLGGE